MNIQNRHNDNSLFYDMNRINENKIKEVYKVVCLEISYEYFSMWITYDRFKNNSVTD